MYAFLAVVLLAALVAVMVAAPLLFDRILARVRPRVRQAVLCTANQALFQADTARARHTIQGMRAWFFLSAIVFTWLGIRDGAMIANHPGSLAAVAGYGVLAFAITSVVIVAIFGYCWLVPGLRGYATLQRCGFRGLWVLPSQKVPKDLARDLSEAAARSSRLCVVDVAGYELFVRGAGDRGGALRDVVESRPDLPVEILLLNPMTQDQDPDSRHLTVYQSLLAELGMEPTTYMKRLRRAIAAIDALNRERSPEAQIRVRYYNEKPAMRAIIFDESMIVFPWGSRLTGADVPCLELARKSDAPSFYETFRRDFVRLWKDAIGRVAVTRSA